MNLFQLIRNHLQEPSLIGVDPDSEHLLEIQIDILSKKKMMREVFTEFYDKCIELDKKHFGNSNGKQVEVGAGVSFFKKRYPGIISTDIKKAVNLDMVVDVQKMPFEDLSVRAIYGINCFHHVPNPDLFFVELERVLDKGCGCILIEPYHGTVARYFYKRIFKSETFDANQKDWNNESMGYMNGANQALSYIVFKRDQKKFEGKYPNLEIVAQRPLNNYLRYLLSGGLNFKQVLPSFFAPAIKCIEFLLIPLNSILALHQVVVIRKRK
jgi:hypothetical protein